MLSQGNHVPPLEFGRDSKTERVLGKLNSGKSKGFQCALTGACWPGKFSEEMSGP